jgi:hypothetical protein
VFLYIRCTAIFNLRVLCFWTSGPSVYMNGNADCKECLPSILYPGVLFPRVERRGVKLTTHLHLSGEVKNVWGYTSTPPYVFMAWCLVKLREFTNKVWRIICTHFMQACMHTCIHAYISNYFTAVRDLLCRDMSVQVLAYHHADNVNRRWCCCYILFVWPKNNVMKASSVPVPLGCHVLRMRMEIKTALMAWKL